MVACSVLSGEEVPLAERQLDLVRSLSADHWEPAANFPEEDLAFFAEHGLIVTDGGGGDLEELRRRDEVLMGPAWNRYAALYHAFTRWSDVKALVAGEQPWPTTPDRWPPPPHFYAAPSSGRIDLPLVEVERPLYRILRERRTIRGFDQTRQVTFEELSTVLRYVWGCWGTREVKPELTILKKTSPSGGAEHPVEVYPLVQSVSGVETGLYHYSVEHHALECLEVLPRDEVRDLIRELSACQEHFAPAHVVFLMTARYARNYWKYPAHDKAYRTVVFDAALLTQTLYLVATELGLGAFVAAAINEHNVDRRLGLQSFTEGCVVMTGLGVPAFSPREPEFIPYDPRT